MSDYWGSEAAGVILFDPESRKFGLGLRSAQVDQPETLGSFGGAMEPGDSVLETVQNEVMEELGYFMPPELEALPCFEDSGAGFRYHNHIMTIDPQYFDPSLNWENDAIVWLSYTELKNQPKEDLHFGVHWLLGQDQTHKTMKRHIINHTPKSEASPTFGV